jgi:ribosome-associated toxin RatA of RatAB toxin-antitoxin module
MASVKFTETIVIDNTAEIVFDFTQDYNTRLRWDTFLKRADLIEGATQAGKGVQAYCVAKNGIGMVTEYVTFNRPRVTAIKMTRGPYMFKSFLGSWTFKEMPGNKTEVLFLYSFSLRFPFNLVAFGIKHILQRNVQQRLIDLKKNIETQYPKTEPTLSASRET